MKLIGMVLALASTFLLATGFWKAEGGDFVGRWDLTVHSNGETYPSWIEVSEGASPAVRIVARTGSVHPAHGVKLENSKLTFSEGNADEGSKWELSSNGQTLTGTEKRGSVTGEVTGVRAPALDRKVPADWSKAQPLFNGKNLDGWTPDNPAKNNWKVIDGALVNEAPGANLRSDKPLNDFKLHIEFNCPKDGNSGIYLRGRYEVQVEYVDADKEDKLHSLGSIYGFIAPSVDLPRRPGKWETFDVTLVGRTVTVIRDGTKTIDAQQIPGITGGALDSHEGEPGTIYIQGDHTGGMKYRNIKIQVPKG
jgi:3-keto-disaccharide hydrolase